MANICPLQQKYKPRFELPENLVPRLHKVQYRNWHYSSKRAWKTYTYATKNQVLGIFQTRKQTNHKIGLAIFMTTFIYFSYPETFGVQNMPKAYKKTGLISNFNTVCTK